MKQVVSIHQGHRQTKIEVSPDRFWQNYKTITALSASMEKTFLSCENKTQLVEFFVDEWSKQA